MSFSDNYRQATDKQKMFICALLESSNLDDILLTKILKSIDIFTFHQAKQWIEYLQKETNQNEYSKKYIHTAPTARKNGDGRNGK